MRCQHCKQLLSDQARDAIRWVVALTLAAIIVAVLVFTPAACWKP
jgi:uncharacterized paraquat-inducible protein A